MLFELVHIQHSGWRHKRRSRDRASYACEVLTLFTICQLFNFHIVSGDEGIRTPDPLLARQVLSQLSYTPKSTA